MKYLIMLVTTWTCFNVFSCDVCGGITAPGTQGLLSSNAYHYIGLNQSYNRFESHHLMGTESMYTQEHFLKNNFTARWQFSKGFNGIVQVPINANLQTSEHETISKIGLGDINIALNHIAVKQELKEEEKLFVFQYGFGLKLPTGNYAHDAWETSNLYPGTGSFDYFVNTNLVFRKKNLGLLQENNVIVKGTNKEGYQFGSSVLTRFAGFYKRTNENGRSIIPSIGCSYLFTGTDKISGINVAYMFNSGHSVNAEAGLNLLIPQWMFSMKALLPIYQNIGNGDILSKVGLELGIHYLIEKKK